MPDGDIDREYLKKTRILGFCEGVSTLVLFGIAMPLKYTADQPMAVTIAGSIHGVLFMALAIMLWQAIDRVPMSRRLAAWGIVGAILPFGPFVVDRWLVRLEQMEQ